ncbi:hypothetical protein GOBAR_AA12154 [Gossypium barbadense]|uniref:Uncharacterized protein n=1 Tax=Gossypium barbadense TaxID=3634 RepID=A0A2P5XYS1_GOSBA|nr:hypothetical protein GOBAR_AA12154 [Gossypium barbadense]
MWGKNDDDLAERHRKHNEAWNRRMHSLPVISRICYHWRRGEDKFDVRGNDHCHSSSIGGDAVARRDRHWPQQKKYCCVYAIYGIYFLALMFPLYFTPMPTLMPTQMPGAYIAYNDDTDTDAHATVNADVDAYIVVNVDAWGNADVPKIWVTLWLEPEGISKLCPNDDDIEEEVYRPALSYVPPVAPLDVNPIAPLIVRKNPSCNFRPQPCGTNSLG